MATTTTVLRTDEAWDGQKLPNYLVGKTEVVINKVLIPPKTNLPWHHHDVMSYAYVIRGEFYVVLKEENKEKHFKQGNVLCEVVGKIHRGENRSDKECELVVFYPSIKDQILMIKHPECENAK